MTPEVGVLRFNGEDYAALGAIVTDTGAIAYVGPCQRLATHVPGRPLAKGCYGTLTTWAGEPLGSYTVTGEGSAFGHRVVTYSAVLNAYPDRRWKARGTADAVGGVLRLRPRKGG